MNRLDELLAEARARSAAAAELAAAARRIEWAGRIRYPRIPRRNQDEWVKCATCLGHGSRRVTREVDPTACSVCDGVGEIPKNRQP